MARPSFSLFSLGATEVIIFEACSCSSFLATVCLVTPMFLAMWMVGRLPSSSSWRIIFFSRSSFGLNILLTKHLIAMRFKRFSLAEVNLTLIRRCEIQKFR